MNQQPRVRTTMPLLTLWTWVPFLAVIAVVTSAWATPAIPAEGENPVEVHSPLTITTPRGTVHLSSVQVYSNGALIRVSAELNAAPTDLLDHPEQVLTQTPGHESFALTLRTTPASVPAPGPPTRATPDTPSRHWNLAFWLPRAKWTNTTPHIVWPVAQIDTALDITADTLARAALTIHKPN